MRSISRGEEGEATDISYELMPFKMMAVLANRRQTWVIVIVLDARRNRYKIAAAAVATRG